jgi:hypothetical protein
MSDVSFSESDFYLIFSVLGIIGILITGTWYIILEFQSRRFLRMRNSNAVTGSNVNRAATPASPSLKRSLNHE